VVGCVGLVADVRQVPGAWREGDVVLAAGAPELALDGSEYQARFLAGGSAGSPPDPDYEAETALVRFLWRSAPLLSAAHDASEGGLAVALAELALWSWVGADISLEADALTWFGEGGGQAVVACAPEVAEQLEGVALQRIGVVAGSKLLGASLDELRVAHA
jgi:phosphoribosylformylglycinamidine synthase